MTPAPKSASRCPHFSIPNRLCSADCKGPTGRVWIDPGGTIYGPGPYIKVECKCGAVTRVYAKKKKEPKP